MSWPEHAGNDSGDDTPVDPDAFARVFETIDRVIEDAVAAGNEAFDRAVAPYLESGDIVEPEPAALTWGTRVNRYKGPV